MIITGGGGILGVVVCLSGLPLSVRHLGQGARLDSLGASAGDRAPGDPTPTESPASEGSVGLGAASEAPTPDAPAASDAPVREFPASDAPTPLDSEPGAPTPDVPTDAAPTSEVSAAEGSPAEVAPATEASTSDAAVSGTPSTGSASLPRDSIFDAGHGTYGDITVSIGGLVDALDPRAAAGASVRVPQFTSDARFGLGKGWSVVAHLNTILAINELDVGASWSFPIWEELRGILQFQTGVFVGMLGSFGFDSRVIVPQFRPLVGVSLPVGTMRWSLRGEIVFAGPYMATLGEVSDTLATPPAIANWNVGLTLEKLMQNKRLWYAGLLMMGSTASYQNWLLFPDTSRYDYYPRLMAGYEF